MRHVLLIWELVLVLAGDVRDQVLTGRYKAVASAVGAVAVMVVFFVVLGIAGYIEMI